MQSLQSFTTIQGLSLSSKFLIISVILATKILLGADQTHPKTSELNSQIAAHCLLESYSALECESQNILRFRSNPSLVWNLALSSTNPLAYKESLQNPKLIDSFIFPYPLGNFAKKPYEDSSRIRDILFFTHLYGANETEVKQYLKPLIWLDGTKILFNTQNGAYEALERVRNRLAKLIESNPHLKVYLQNIGGTFKWRKIANSHNLSAHSFGIAIDINVANSRYWLWDLQSHVLSNPQSVATIPLEIIEAFESENFIWGGRWWHYDTMHFEYRPEILCYAKALLDSNSIPLSH